MMLLVILISLVSLMILSGYQAYLIFCLIEMDATYRGMKRPKFWALLSLSHSGEGLLFYLFKRQKYPRSLMTAADQDLFARLKTKAKVTLVFQGLLIALFLLGLLT